MAAEKRTTITPAEFDKRLDASNTKRQQELQQREEEQTRVEQLLTHYEQALDVIEAEFSSSEALPSYPTLLRTRLQELASKTAEIAASL